jgi:hypothetical protein
MACCLLVVAGTAHAGVIQVNLYGASAQYNFWTSAAPEFLIDTGCAPANVYTANTADACPGKNDRDVGVAVCIGDTAYGNLDAQPTGGMGDVWGTNTIVFTYTTFASFEGINAVQCLNPSGLDNPPCTDPCQRLLPSGNNINLVLYDPADPTLGDVNECECLDVVLGASDVAPTTFKQQSSGQALGPCGGGAYSASVFNYSVPGNFLEFEPIVVPFSFFVNAQPNKTIPFDNLSREQVLLLYSQSVLNWNFLKPDLDGDGTPNEPGDYLEDGSGGDSLPVVLCLRHAGSGTHATLEAAIARGDISLPFTENTVPLFAPVTYFNKGSSDMMRCVGGGCGSWMGYGAIGYADSDKCCGGTVGVDTCACKDGLVKRVDYQGYTADRQNVKNGNAIFWAAQKIYEDPADAQNVRDLSQALMTYAANPLNIPAAREDWWAAQDEMQVQKLTDFAFPTVK